MRSEQRSRRASASLPRRDDGDAHLCKKSDIQHRTKIGERLDVPQLTRIHWEFILIAGFWSELLHLALYLASKKYVVSAFLR